MDEPALTPCRVTVHLTGARAGDIINADLDDPDNQVLLERQILVPLDTAPVPAPNTEDEDAGAGEDEPEEAASPESDEALLGVVLPE